MLSLYWGSKEGPVLLTKSGNTETTAGSGSRMKELEDSLSKVTEEKNKVVNNLIEYKVANEEPAGKTGKKEVDSTCCVT